MYLWPQSNVDALFSGWLATGIRPTATMLFLRYWHFGQNISLGKLRNNYLDYLRKKHLDSYHAQR
jgi:hypothetical protein